MDKLIKIGKWVWYAKERMMLAVMLIVLGVQVYHVVFPPKTLESTTRLPSPPRKEPPADFEAPSAPTPASAIPPAQNWNTLVSRNPWWLYSRKVVTEEEVNTEDIQLKKIMPWKGGTFRAQIYTKTKKPSYYSEGEKFENFTLVKIDAAAGTCEVYSEKSGKTITLKPEQ